MNIRSLIPSLVDIRDVIWENNFQVLCLSETWLSPEYPSELLQIPNYALFRKDRITRGGGVAVFVATSINVTVLDTTFLDSDSDNDVEQLWLGISFKNIKVLMGMVYKPPLVAYHKLKCVENVLATLAIQFDYIIVLGDMNVNFFNDGRDVIFVRNMLETFNMTQVVTDPTRVTRTSSSLLDIICVDAKLNVLETGTREMYNITNHRLTYCNIKLDAPRLTQKALCYRNFRDFDIDRFNFDMQQINWQTLSENHDINARVESLTELLIEIFDTHAPVKNVILKRPYKPYITDTIKEIIKLKKKAFNKFKRTHNPVDKNLYLDLKNYLSFAIKTEKEIYMKLEIKKNNKDAKTLWSKFKQWGLNTKTRDEIPSQLKNVNRINEHFNSVNHMATPIVEAVLNFYETTRFTPNIEFTFRMVSEEDVRKAFKKIKSKAMGIDNIGYVMLEWSMPYIDKVVKDIINMSLESGEYPNIWKISIVKPIPKISNAQMLNDLRPINILPILSKLCEILVREMFLEYVNNNNILPNVQSGFRANYSTNTALHKVTTDITQGIDDSKVSCLVLLDYSKAFDLLNQELLIKKLRYYGLSDLACQWFSNYLKGRTQIVEVDGIRSNPANIKHGVAQGSILGPILFSIYTANLTEIIKHCNIHLYADDTQLLKSFDPWDASSALLEVNLDLDRIADWSKDHGLILNASKSCFVILGTKNLISKFYQYNFTTINIKDVDIPQKEWTKDLGVIVDAELNFEKHVNDKLRGLYMKLKALYKFKFILDEKTKFKLVECLVFPQIDYCISVYYSFLTVEYKNKLQLAQNSCLRFAFNVKKYVHISPVYINQCILKVEYRQRLMFGVYIYKILSRGEPKYLYDYLISRRQIHNLHLREIVRYTIPQHKTAKFENCFAYLAVEMLNNPVYYETIQGRSIANFKIHYKRQLLNEQEHGLVF